MNIKDYFEKNKGLGVLSTADGNGIVNLAVYARPHSMEDGPGYHGKRLYLTRIREEENSELISSLSRRTYASDKDRRESKFLVFFKLEKERPLVGG